MYDLLEPAQELRLKTQEEQADLINMADLIGQTRHRYEHLHNKIKAQPNLISEFPMLKNILSKMKSTNFFGADQDSTTAYKYQNIVLKYFLQAKQKALNVAPNILQEICNSFEQRFGGLEDDELVNKTAKQSDSILYHICKCMNIKSSIVAAGSCNSTDTFQRHIDSLKYIFNQFKDMSSLKTIAFHELEEQFIELIEYVNK